MCIHCSIHRSAIYQLAPPTLVTVVNNPTLSTILNMADSVASSVSKNFSLLEHIPNSISVDFLPNSKEISSKSLDKGLNYFVQGYIHEIEFSRNQNFVTVSAKCWPSMRKNNPPHKLNMDISDTSIVDAFCTCTAGYV